MKSYQFFKIYKCFDKERKKHSYRSFRILLSGWRKKYQKGKLGTVNSYNNSQNIWS